MYEPGSLVSVVSDDDDKPLDASSREQQLNSLNAVAFSVHNLTVFFLDYYQCLSSGGVYFA